MNEDEDLFPESEIGRLEGTVEALEGLLTEEKTRADRLRQGIVSVLAPVFVTEVNGEKLAATMSDGMLLAALADQVRRQDEGASLLADVAANLEVRAEKAEAENDRLRTTVLDELTREGQALESDGPPVPGVEVPPESAPDEARSGGAIDPDEGTERYRAARANVLQDPRAEAVHGEVTREIESHVAQRAVDPGSQWGDYMRGANICPTCGGAGELPREVQEPT